jgi:hypothetical protein
VKFGNVTVDDKDMQNRKDKTGVVIFIETKYIHFICYIGAFAL